MSVTNIATLEGVAREATARYRFRALLIAAFAAQPEAVIGLIARGAARVLIPGVVVGVALALVMGQLLGAMLFGVRAFDAATFTPVLVVLAVTAAASVAGPALRATRIDPVGALRSD